MSNLNLPDGWKQCKIEEIANIYVGRDLKEESYSKTKTEKHTYPVYSNSVDNYGLYGYYDFEEYPSKSSVIFL
jgi:type I restriction enzyme S subunit